MRRLILKLSSVLALGFLLSACNSSDHDIRSPDLPAPELNSLNLSCINPVTGAAVNSLIVGQNAQCSIQCTYKSTDSSGHINISNPGTCHSPSFSTSNPNVAGVTSVSSNGDVIGNVLGTGQGTVTITGSTTGGSASEIFTITAPTVSCLSVYVSGATPPPAPVNGVCQSPATLTASVPVGVSQNFLAQVLLTNGVTCTAPGNCPTGVVIFSSDNAAIATIDPNSGIATGVAASPPVAHISATGTGAAGTVNSVDSIALTVVTPANAVLSTQLCVEPLTPTTGCTAPGSYTAATVQCQPSPDVVPTLLVGGNPFQFRATAFFNVNTPNGFTCDVTTAAATTWSLVSPGSAGSNPPTVVPPTVGTVAANTGGLVSAGNVATNGAIVGAVFTAPGVHPGDPNQTTTTPPTTPPLGAHTFNVALNTGPNSLVIAPNSLVASVETVSSDPTNAMFGVPNRVACVGSYDLVNGLAVPPTLPAQKNLFSVLRRCPIASIQPDGTCDPTKLSKTLEDVTNAEPTNNLPAGQIAWKLEDGNAADFASGKVNAAYWDGAQCVQATNPASNLVPAELGNLDALTHYLANQTAPCKNAGTPALSTTQGGSGGGCDTRMFTAGTPPFMDNGVGVSTGVLRLGTACMTATYTEGVGAAAKSAKDGVTLIVLPVTNDELLKDPNATEVVDLCNTLVPLFNLGSSPNGANGAVTQVVSSVADILNPVLTGVSPGTSPANPPSIDSLLTQVVTALNPLTGPVSSAVLDPVLTAANAGVYAPLNCAIGQLLKGIATQDPSQVNITACTP